MYERQVTLRVESATRGLVGELTINIVRPPVALIHGIWSDDSTWYNSSPLYESPVSHDPHFFIRLVDYESTNAAPFVTNAQATKTQLRNHLDDFKIAQQVAAVRFDVVAHSMGGLVTRTIVDLPDYQRPENYTRGDVHKLITIDSPHAGSALAPRLIASNRVCKFFWDKFGKNVSAGAVGDLVPGSLALFELTDQRLPDYPQVPAHVVAGVASPTQTMKAEAAYSNGAISWICPSLLPSGGYQTVFGGDNDLIVGSDSMLAFDNMFFGQRTPLTVSGIGEIPPSRFSNFIHTVDKTLFPEGPDVLGRELMNGMIATHPDRSIQLRVIELLNEPSYGYSFEPIRPGGL